MKKHFFTGTTILTKFIFRRDRGRLFIWILCLVGFIVGLVPVFDNLFTTDLENIVLLEMMQNPAMVAIVGPVYGIENYHTGASYANMMLVFSVMIVGVMNIFLVSRHTRQDEELGRMEVIRSLPVGRLSNLASTMLTAAIINLVLSLLAGFGLYAARSNGMDFTGCMLFGASLGVIGFFFAAVTALFAQMSTNNRTVLGLSFMLMLVLYMLRAVGDIGTEILSLISPLGLILRTETFVHNYWWPVFVVLLISILVGMVSLVLASKRDLGRGLISERPGRKHGSNWLSGPMGLSLKLLRTSILVWTITIFVLAAMYGSVFGDLESFLGSNEMLSAIFAANTEFSLTEQFVALLVVIMSIIGTLPVLSFVHRIDGEEKSGHTEHILGGAVTRKEQMQAYVLPAFVISILLQFLTALGFWSVGSLVLDTAPTFDTFIKAALSYLPAIWVMMGVAMAVVAYLPGKTFLSYVYLGYGFLAVYLGSLANLPDIMKWLTPFGHIPQYPIEELNVGTMMMLTGIAIILVSISFMKYAKRDVQMQ